MIARLGRIARPAWLWLAGSLLARVVNLAAAIALAALPVWAIARVWGGGEVSLILLAAALIVIAVLAGAARYLEHYLGHRAAFDLLARMRLDFFDAIAPLSADDEDSASADLTTVATRDIDRVEVFFAHTIVPAVTALVVPIAVIAAIWAGAGTPAGLVAAAAFAVGVVVVPLVGARASSRAAGQTASVRARIADHLASDVAGLAEIRTLGAEDKRMAALAALDGQLADASRRGGAVLAIRRGLTIAWPFAAAIAILALADRASLASHLVAAVAVIAAAPAATAVEAFARSLPAALASARRYLAIVDRAPSIADPADPESIPEGPLGLRVSGVSYGYGDALVLDGVDAEVAAGGSLGIVGASGSGKSTLASLLVRQRDPRAGSIELVGGERAVGISRVRLADLRRAIALVEQRPVLVSGTVLANLRFGNPQLSDDDAWLALERAALADDVRAHPDGLNARLSEDALSLSGGQRQRLALARALARTPRIVILDEATSHQDPQTARAVRAGAQSLPGVTLIVIAHRSAALEGIGSVLRMGAA
ncbi:ABC transporter permease [Microbacterium sorbitolivorans]|uniref:ABC transporter ATP-binding protein n=1 Tax=Microbacterium sorbitolivorans TaxID=1867410 RepID=A0A367Y5R6_9MICO|nr:ABC transporter ATP-binding protein [Microbacterium sorbitolivorans]RCK61215.1 ABC transporter ATP-binding protein [Microbacterium sorbitolivorans]GGF34047.1 ABC transporter permease [Microbacterium sorbitolivorans]